LSFTLLTRRTPPGEHQTNPPNDQIHSARTVVVLHTPTQSKAMPFLTGNIKGRPIIAPHFLPDQISQTRTTPIPPLALLIPITSGHPISPEPPQIKRISSSCARVYLPGRPRPRHARRRPGRTATPAAAAAAASPRLRRRGLGGPWRPSVTRSRRAGTASGPPRIGEGGEGSRGGEGSGILGVGR